MKSLKMLILFEIGLILVYFYSLKQKLSPTKRFKRFSKGGKGVRLGENCDGFAYRIPIDMLLDEKYSKYLRFRRLKNLKELNETLK